MFQELKSDYQSIITNVMKQLQPDFIEANKEQMLDGLNAVGGNLPVYRNPFYMDYKSSKGSRSLPFMDFKDTGDFHNSIKAVTDNEGTEMFATDGKSGKLEKMAGGVDKLYGLTDNSIDKVTPKATELLLAEIRKSLDI